MRGNKKGKIYRKKENPKIFFYPKDWMSFYNSLNDIPLRKHLFSSKFYFNFLLQTGARQEELRNVEVRDIDFERNSINIRFAKTRLTNVKKIKVSCPSCNIKINITKDLRFCPACGKEINNIENLIKEYKENLDNRRREIRVIKVSENFINELKNKIKEKKLKESDNFNFPTKAHLNRVLKNTLNKLKIKDFLDFSPHNLRKTHENYLIALGSNPLSMRLQMGHSIDVAIASYISNNLFNSEDKTLIKVIMGGLVI
jgi:integrase